MDTSTQHEALRVLDTRYADVWIVTAEIDGCDGYWIQDDRGGGTYYGSQHPTERDVDEYVTDLHRLHWWDV